MRPLLVAGGWLYAAAIVYLSLTPTPPEPGFEYGDKLGHVLAYALLMLWFALLYRSAGARLAYGALWIALGIALLFHSDVLRVSTGDPNNAALLVFLAVTTAIWLGSIDGSREIIKERALMERERAVGVKLSAYLASKAAVLFVLVAVQCVLLAAIIFGLRSLHQPASVVKISGKACSKQIAMPTRRSGRSGATTSSSPAVKYAVSAG